MKSTVKLLSYLSISFFIVSMVSCAVMPHKGEVGNPIDEELVSKIKNGKTTREEIIQWFGIPKAVAKKGEKINVPTAMASAFMGSEMPGQEVSSDIYFVLFSNHQITDNHKIYLYLYTKSSGTGFAMPFVSYQGGKTLTDTLVILINESSGIVEDYKFDKKT